MQVRIGRETEIPIEEKLAIALTDMQLIIIRIENLEAVLRTLRKWKAVPDVFTIPVRQWFTFARPTGDFHLGPPGSQPRLARAHFDSIHRTSSIRASWRNGPNDILSLRQLQHSSKHHLDYHGG